MSESWREITYPISLNYRNHWSEWEAIREIVQNSLDASEEFQSFSERGNFIIQDQGQGLQVKHLLFGVSEKESKDARGKFGEGLKIAIIVLKRLGYDVEILSNDLEVKASTTEIEGQKCLSLLYRHNGQKFQGTRITIKGYAGESFTDRFVRKGDNKKILFESARDQLLEKGEMGQLFVKDIFVQKLDNSEFSYNLSNVVLEESRNITNEYDLAYQLGYLWKQIDSVELWIRLFNAFKNSKYEKKIKFRSAIDDKIKQSINLAFNTVFPNSVLKTDVNWSREATWRGKEIADVFNSWDQDELFKILPTDKAFVIADCAKEDIFISDEKLSEDEKKNLDIARELAIRVKEDQKIDVYLMDSASGKAGNPIKLNRLVLKSLKETLSTTIHELTHTYYNSSDLTIEMFHKLSDMGATLLEFYLKTSFEAGVLMQKVGKYEQFRISLPKEIAQSLNLSKGQKVKVSVQK